MQQTETAGALAGLVVLDLTQMLAGPYATMMLADQGARVIRIEPPGGDQTRLGGPHLPGARRLDDGGYGAYFASTNRNKESIVIDLKQAAGRSAFLRLVDGADVVVENFRAGVMDRLGLGYEALAQRNPRLVYGALRGFGDPRSGSSPFAAWPAYDPIAQAFGGIMGITGPVIDGPPTKVGPGVGDILPAMFLAFGLVSACLAARASGRGQFVDVAMADAVLAVCERLVFQYSVTGKPPGPEGNGHPLLAPFGLFEARDGYISLGVPNDRFWRPLCRLMERPELADDPRYRSKQDRADNRREVEALVAAWVRQHSREELATMLGGEIPFAPVFGADDIFGSAHFAARQMLVDVDQPGAERPLTIANTPLKMSATPGGVRCRAPLVGEHGDAVLGDFGFDPAEIAALRAGGAIA